MANDRFARVHDQFGEPLPDGLDALSDEQLDDLATALADADREQARALDGAIDHTLRFLPWPLNGIVRKVLIG
ncbi:MAG TPA: hypothetical protein VHZ31_03660 [Solirubrobacteraceae bacterium]|jgi:hypothetical protein|nr:hypothetical protein [Solirubrobacteraceae bacterium]